MSDKPASKFAAAQPYLSLLVRLAAGAIMIVAGVAKMRDLAQSVRAVRAYELLPESVVPLVGNALPFVEVAVGLLLIAGLLTRTTVFVYLAMLAAFLFGLFWAWGHGLMIDCGCFGGGGQVAAEDVDYAGHLWERAGFIALGVWLAIWPRSAFSVDGVLAASKARLESARAAAGQ